MLAETIPETQESPRLRMSHSLRISHKTLRSLYHVVLRRPTLVHSPTIVDPATVTLPLHTYRWGIRCAKLTWYSNLEIYRPAGQTSPLRLPVVYILYKGPKV